VVEDESTRPHERETQSPAAAAPGHGFGELRHYVPQEILDVSFPVSVRGYSRRAVDAYVKHVNRVIAELKVSASPPAAVRHALEQAEEKVQGLLHAAREAADELTTSARREAEASTARAKAEAAELVVNTSAEAERVKAEGDERLATARREADETVAKAKAAADELVAAARAEAQDTLARAQADADERLQRSGEELAALRNEAETRLREIEADTAAVWKQRRELLDDIRAMASSLLDAANAAAGRFPRQEPADAETEPAAIPTDQSAPALPAVGSDESGDDESREVVATPRA
jgi:DivIVA domain-containing protein